MPWADMGWTPHPDRRPRFLRQPDEAAVTPVIGTILILVITVFGMAAVMYYGAPTIDRIQSRNAQTAMTGSFEVLRDSAQELSVPDHARFPTISVPSGTLALEEGNRFLISVAHDPANTSCDLHVTQWTDGDGQAVVSASGCRTPVSTCTTPMLATQACMEVHQVLGTTTSKKPTTVAGAAVTAAGADFSEGDWLFRLTDGEANPTIFAQAWLHSTDDVTWRLRSGTGQYNVFLDAGAIFSESGGTTFLHKEASIADSAFGSDYYGFWLRSLVATDANAITSSGSHSVSLSLMGVSERVDATDVRHVRFDIAGPHAEAWCNSLTARNNRLSGTAAYTEEPGFSCASGDAAGVRSVDFARTASAPFTFRFLHARISATLVI